MTGSPDAGGSRSVFWRAASWSAVFWTQAVLGVFFATLWLLEQGPFSTPDLHGGERAWVLIAAAIVVLVGLVVSAVLARSRLPRRRALALGLAGSAVVVGLCAVSVAFAILRWAL
jgi:hypothetical protein